MNNGKLVAVVGLGAILPDALDVASFWNNIISNKYSITEVPANRWNVDLYYDPDPAAVDKTYCKIGAFVRDYQFDPLKHGLAIPPKLLAVMDNTQQWAIAASQQALNDYGYPGRKLDPERVAVVFGNANAGEAHYRSTFRLLMPEYLDALQSIPDFIQLPDETRAALIKGIAGRIHAKIPAITEDTMPGELSNIIPGRVANVFNFSGPNFVTDAACASSLAALQAAVQGLTDNKFDAVLTGGIDRSMGPESYIKFSKIGALSPDGSRPYAESANGFVMGEGAVVFLLKRLEDAERDNDKIYAIVCGIGGSSDGKGKGITAPNPLGQQRAIERAWLDAGIQPEAVGLIEGHGTSTKVGDVTEVNSLNSVFGSLGLQSGAVVLGSVKSNIGHLKSAAGAVGLLKAILSLQHQVLPSSANFDKPNPNIDFSSLPFRVNNQPQEWSVKEGSFRFAGVSSFGFGGTNFHVVLEEYFPGVAGNSASTYPIPQGIHHQNAQSVSTSEIRTPALSSEVTLQNTSNQAITKFILAAVSEKTGYPEQMLELNLDLEADLGVDTVKQAELFAAVRTHFNIPRREDLRLSDYNTLAKVVTFVQDALDQGGSQMPVGQEKSIDLSQETNATPVALSLEKNELKPYQGLFFASADSPSILKGILEKELQKVDAGIIPESRCPTQEEISRHERIAIDYSDEQELKKRLEKALSEKDFEKPVMNKALQAHGIYRNSGKPGKVAFLFPGQGSQYVNMLLDLQESEPVVRDTFDEADRVMTPILGRALTSFIYTQGGEAELQQAEQELKNTAITQPAMLTANVAMLRVLKKYGIEPDLVIGHSLGEYAALVAAGVLTFAEALEVVSARGREMTRIKLEDTGCMAAVSAPLSKVEEVIQSIDDYLVIANINSPVQAVLGGTTRAIDLAIQKFQADGFQAVKIPVSHAFHTKIVAPASAPLREVIARMDVKSPQIQIVANVTGELYPSGREEILNLLASQVASPVQFVKGMKTLYDQGVRIFIEVGPKRVLNALAMDNLKDHDDVTIIATNHPRKGGKASFNEALCGIYAAGIPNSLSESKMEADTHPGIKTDIDNIQVLPELVFQQNKSTSGSVVISGAALGLPGKHKHVFEDTNIESILKGEMRIDPLTDEVRHGMLEKHVTRLVKSEAGAVMEDITDMDQTLKLAGQSGTFDLVNEFGVPQERVESLDASTQLAIAAGIEALKDAGIPLVMNYKRTTTGTYLPDRWKLPESMQDETGVIFCSAFPGLNRMAEEVDRYYETRMLERQLSELRATMDLVNSLHTTGQTYLQNDIQRRMIELENKIKAEDYHFDRRYVFRILAMGHSQFAEYIGARGPNTHVNAACATTTHAVAIAEDWIRAGRCRRVVVIAGDDVTNPTLVSWIGTSLFASGAATTEGNLRMAALPFDERRNGMIMGMGAAALVIESEDAVQERGVRAIGEILSTNIANSAFHGTRLDVQHVSEVMERLLTTAEERFSIRREQIAREMVFISHETYTPARGGSASAEIHALRSCFGDQSNQVVIANTKGFTGHAMGVGIEDVLAVKTLETGLVPPIAYIHDGFEPDPELGDLNLSQGGEYNPQYALRLGAGFGSQIAMTLIRKIPGSGERINREKYNRWLSAAAGYDQAELEVVQRTLRIKSQGVPARAAEKSRWKYGQCPSAWAKSQDSEANQSAATTESFTPTLVHIETNPAILEKTEIESTPVFSALHSDPQESEIKDYILAAVSEKTGYPVEMLDLDLDLEADLGIDTVKQAELFADIRTHYNIPRREDLILADYNTLARVMGFVQDALGLVSQTELIALQENVTPNDPVVEVETAPSEILPLPVDSTNTNITCRVPVPVLFPRLDLCLPTGINLENKRVVVVSDTGKVAGSLARKLKSAGAEVLQASPAGIYQKLETWLKEGEIAGVYFLPALDADPAWENSTIAEWKNARDMRIETLFQIAKSVPAQAFLVAATRMGGLHGVQNAENPLGGGVTGFIKALKRERPDQLLKVIDFEENAAAGFIAQELVSETLHDPVTVEIGRENDTRYGIALRAVQDDESVQTPLEPGSVFVVSGATGGIMGPVIRDLATAAQGTFYLLGRTQLVDTNDPDLVKLRTDRNAFRMELQDRLSENGVKASLREVEQKLSAIERGAVTLETMKMIEQSGGKAAYIQCDVTNSDAVLGVIESISKIENQVNVFIHGAGLEKSRKIESKTVEEFQLVVSAKTDGLVNVFKALEKYDRLPQKVVLFSSVAGRFGNAGQTDYSAANDLLSKYAMWMQKNYPGLQAVSIDWGAWAEVGMASRGSIPMLMERAGIEMLKPDQAAPMVRKVFSRGNSGEVVVAGSLGLLESNDSDNAGMDIETADKALRAGSPIHTMFSHLVGFHFNTGICLEATLDPEELSYLRDHAINGIPVLPGVMGIEGFSVASKHIASVLASSKSGFEVERLENIQFHAPFKFYGNKPRTITWNAVAYRQAEGLIVNVSLESNLKRWNGSSEHFLHFSGLVHLSQNTQVTETMGVPPKWENKKSISSEDIYKLYFHGPSFQVLDAAQLTESVVLGRFNKQLKGVNSDNPGMFTTPLLIELCFQTAGLWEIGTTGILALPRSIGNLMLYPQPVNGVAIYAEVKPHVCDGNLSFDARVVDAKGHVFLEITNYKTSQLPYPAEKALVEPMKVLVAGGPSPDCN